MGKITFIIYIISIIAFWIMCLVNMTSLRNKITKIIHIILTISLAISLVLVGIITATELYQRSPNLNINNNTISISYNKTLYNSDFVTLKNSSDNQSLSTEYVSIISAYWKDGSCDGIIRDNQKITLKDFRRAGETMTVLVNTNKGNLSFDVTVTKEKRN